MNESDDMQILRLVIALPHSSAVSRSFDPLALTPFIILQTSAPEYSLRLRSPP